MQAILRKTGFDFKAKMELSSQQSEKNYIIPPDRTRYLAEIVEANADYTTWVNNQSKIAQQLFQIHGALGLAEEFKQAETIKSLKEIYIQL
jgi:methylmalonyl-CoA mutase